MGVRIKVTDIIGRVISNATFTDLQGNSYPFHNFATSSPSYPGWYYLEVSNNTVIVCSAPKFKPRQYNVGTVPNTPDFYITLVLEAETTPPSPSTPVEEPWMRPWLRALYIDILNREPDPQGFQHQLNALLSGTSRNNIAKNFVYSLEHRTLLTHQFYQQFLDRSPDPEGREFYINNLNRWSIQQVIVAFCNSIEFKTKHPVPNQFIEYLYIKILNRRSDPQGFQHQLNALNSGLTHEQLIWGFLKSPEFGLKMSNEYYQKFYGQPYRDEHMIRGLQNARRLQDFMEFLIISSKYIERAINRFR